MPTRGLARKTSEASARRDGPATRWFTDSTPRGSNPRSVAAAADPLRASVAARTIEHNRDGDLADDQQAAKPRRAEGRRGLAAQRVGERQARRLQRGQQREEQRGPRGDGKGEHEHPDVEVERHDAHQHRRATAAAWPGRRTSRRAAPGRRARGRRGRPDSEISRPSVSSWRTTRPRLAPSDRRTPISRCRALARASITFETLAQAATRTSAKAANTGESTASMSSVNGVGVACGRGPRDHRVASCPAAAQERRQRARRLLARHAPAQSSGERELPRLSGRPRRSTPAATVRTS